MKPVILDCVPGHDDMAVCARIGRSDIPVFRGCSTPLVRELITAPHIHEKNGLDIDRIQSAGNPVAHTVAPILRYFSNANKRQFGMAGAPLHHPVTIAYTIDPKVIRTENYNVVIETRSELTRGRTVIDLDYFKKMIFESLCVTP